MLISMNPHKTQKKAQKIVDQEKKVATQLAKRKSQVTLVAFLFLFSLMSGLSVSVLRNDDVDAQTHPGKLSPALLTILPETSVMEVNVSQSIAIYANTQFHDTSKIQLRFTITGDIPENLKLLPVTSSSLDLVSQHREDTLSGSTFTMVFSAKRNGGTRSLATFNTLGNDVLLAQLDFTPRDNGTLEIRFDDSHTKIESIETQNNIVLASSDRQFQFLRAENVE